LKSTRKRNSESRVRITRTRRVSGRYGDDGVRVYFSFGGRKSSVELRLKDFTESSLKGAIAEKLVVLFSEERARSYVGRSYAIEEIVKDGSRFNESSKDWWLDL
jgi:hypothetical protein